MAATTSVGRVSIWVGFHRVSPDTDLLRDLCGVSRYDPDSQEIIVDDRRWRLRPITNLLRELSYSRSFLTDALAAATDRGIDKALYVLAQFDYVYNPKRVRKPISSDPVFLGCFRWTDDPG